MISVSPGGSAVAVEPQSGRVAAGRELGERQGDGQLGILSRADGNRRDAERAEGDDTTLRSGVERKIRRGVG